MYWKALYIKFDIAFTNLACQGIVKSNSDMQSVATSHFASQGIKWSTLKVFLFIGTLLKQALKADVSGARICDAFHTKRA